MARGPHDPAGTGPQVRLGFSTVVAVVAVVLVVVGALDVRRTRQADTAVEAVAEGRPGCVNAAAFVGPDGVQRTVDVTGYKGSCRDLDPGDRVTVYYDADDPSVTADGRSWWWSGLGVVAALAMAAVALRGVALGVADLNRARRRRPAP